VARNRRLTWRYPNPRNTRIDGPLPSTVQAALAEVDPDARTDVERSVRGIPTPSGERDEARLQRGLDQFGPALLNAALSAPDQIAGLHPQFLASLRSDDPTRKRRPLLALIFVKLPLQLIAALGILLGTAYVGAFFFFNDAVLGSFLTQRISAIIDGDLELESVHWGPTMIVDLLIGRPHAVVVDGARVWAPHRTLENPDEHVLIYAKHLDAKMVLHEIIPWRMIGMPEVFGVPWVLHFTEVRNTGEMWANIDMLADPEWPGGRYVDLIRTFTPPEELPNPPPKQLSFQVDDAKLRNLDIDLDFSISGWQTRLRAPLAEMSLTFDGPWRNRRPKFPNFRHHTVLHDVEGEVDLLGQTVPMSEFSELHLFSGTDDVPQRDLGLRGMGKLRGAPSVIDAVIHEVYGDDPLVNVDLRVRRAAPLARMFLPPQPPEERPMLSGDRVRARLMIEGPFDDPDVRIAAEDATLDLFQDDPEWALEDVDVRLRLAQEEVPDLWRDRGYAVGEKRWMAFIEAFRGFGLAGEIHRRGRGFVDHFILPEEGEPMLMSTSLELDVINPAQLDPGLAALAGTARGRVIVERIVIDEELELADVALRGLRIERSNGPQQDGLPRDLRLDGRFGYDAEKGLRFSGFSVGTAGGSARLDGSLSADYSTLGETSLTIDIDDGDAFARALAIAPYFQTLRSQTTWQGRLLNPRARGSLVVDGARGAGVSLTGSSRADVRFAEGTLFVDSRRIGALGGTGPLSVELQLASGLRVLDDPRIKAELTLDGIRQRRFLSEQIDIDDATLQLVIDNGAGARVPWSELQARGGASADRLKVGALEYRLPSATFTLDAGGVQVDAMRLEHRKAVSPALLPSSRVTSGEVTMSGRVGFEDNPRLDLDVRAAGLPLRALTSLVSADLPIQGALAAGTDVRVTGTVAQPALEGKLALTSLGVSGIPLGHGEMRFQSTDVPGSHREVRVDGEFSDERPGSLGTSALAWRLGALLAFGDPDRRTGTAPLEADVDLTATSLPVDRLLADPDRSDWRPHLAGELDDLVIAARHCPVPERPMLTACRSASTDADPDSTRVDVELGDLWLVAADAEIDLGDPKTTPLEVRRARACDDPSSLCSSEQLVASIRGDRLVLGRPWRLLSGGAEGGSELAIDGRFDLGEVPEQNGTGVCHLDDPDAPDVRPVGDTAATVAGRFQLSALDGFLRPLGIESPAGQLDLDLDVSGLLFQPRVDGTLDHVRAGEALAFELRPTEEGLPIPLLVDDLRARLGRGVAELSGVARLADGDVEFGSPSGFGTHYGLAGPCAGRLSLDARGELDAGIARALWPDLIERAGGSATLDRLNLAGKLADDETKPILDQLTTLDSEVVFVGNRMRLELPFESFELLSGRVQTRLCDADCIGEWGRLAIFLGGERGAGANAAPSDALELLVGKRGDDALRRGRERTARVWGEIDLDAAMESMARATVRGDAVQVPFTVDDHSGRPEITSSLSTRNLMFEATDTGYMRVSADVLVEQSRWERDAQQGVAVLSFEDPDPNTSEPFPDSVRDIELDFSLRTTAPLRSDVNVLKGFEAQAEFELGGTLEEPRVSGVLDIERGVLDIDILGAAFDIERGRVILGDDISSSAVDLLAVRQEPVKIDNQIETITLRLTGALDAIQWECSTAGDRSSTLGTAGGCVDYLIFDAGNVLAVSDDIRRAGSNGLLDQGRRAAALVGNLSEFELNKYLEDEVPRLEEYLPVFRARPGQLGLAFEVVSRPEWFDWGSGQLGLGFSHVRGYPSSYLRSASEARLELEVLENFALQASVGQRNYANRALVLDPPRYRALEALYRLRVPSPR
jgi:hypothetical protein